MSLPARVAATCRRWQMFAPGDRVLVAVSAGPDSVALLAVLQSLTGELRISLGAAHFNHGIRSEEATAADAALVRSLSARYALPVHFGAGAVPELAARAGLSLEHAAREARYAFLRRVAREHGYGRIATGHTLDDQAETVLLALTRGAGLAGLGGIRPVVDDVVRPLIEATRDDVLSFLAQAGISYCTDETNVDPSYPRNRVRHRLLPILAAEFNPSIKQTIARTAEIVREDDRLLDEYAAQLYDRAVVRSSRNVLSLDVAALAQAPAPLARRVLRRAVSCQAEAAGGHVAGDGRPPAAEYRQVAAHVEDLLELLRRDARGAVIELPGSLWAEVGYGSLLIRSDMRRDSAPPATQPGQDCWALPVPGALDVPGRGWRLAARLVGAQGEDGADAHAWRAGLHDGRLAFTAYLAADNLKPPLSVRIRRPGDRMRPHGGPGERKLQDVLVDARLPRRLRDRLPVVCDRDGRILAVLPVRAAQAAVVDSQTKTVLEVTGSVEFGDDAALLDHIYQPW